MGLRDPEPGLPGGHSPGQVGGADPGGEGTQRAVGAGVGVGSQDHVSRTDQSLLGQKGVLDTYAAYVVEVHDPVLLGKLAHLRHQTGSLDVLVRREMVGEERDLGRIEHVVEAGLLELVDGHPGGYIVAEAQVERRHDEIPGATVSLPAALARIFSLMVMPILSSPDR